MLNKPFYDSIIDMFYYKGILTPKESTTEYELVNLFEIKSMSFHPIIGDSNHMLLKLCRIDDSIYEIHVNKKKHLFLEKLHIYTSIDIDDLRRHLVLRAISLCAPLGLDFQKDLETCDFISFSRINRSIRISLHKNKGAYGSNVITTNSSYSVSLAITKYSPAYYIEEYVGTNLSKLLINV